VPAPTALFSTTAGARWEHNSANSNSNSNSTNSSGHHLLLVPLPQQTVSLGVPPDALQAAHNSLFASHLPCQQKLPLQPQQQAGLHHHHSHTQHLRCAQCSQLSTLAASALLQLGSSFQQQQHPLQLRELNLVLWQQQWQAANGLETRMAYHKQQDDTSSAKTHQLPSHSASQLPSLQEQQPGHTAPPDSLYDHTNNLELQGAAAAAAAAAATTGGAGGDRVPGSAFTSLPNLLSLSRVAMGPWLAYCIATQQWPTAVAITAAAGVSEV